MCRKVRVTDSGSSDLIGGALANRLDVENINADLQKRIDAGEQGLKLVEYQQVLLGITKAALANESFLSAASFQETTRVLTEAAIKGKTDPLAGLKENVIIGKLIPAGTGLPEVREDLIRREAERDEQVAAGTGRCPAVNPPFSDKSIKSPRRAHTLRGLLCFGAGEGLFEKNQRKVQKNFAKTVDITPHNEYYITVAHPFRGKCGKKSGRLPGYHSTKGETKCLLLTSLYAKAVRCLATKSASPALQKSYNSQKKQYTDLTAPRSVVYALLFVP